MNYTSALILESLHQTKQEIESQLSRVRLKNRPPETIIEDVCREFGMPKKSLLSKSRTEWILEVRKSMVWLMRSCGVSYPKMASTLEMNHSSLIYLFREFPTSFLKMSDINQESLINIVKKYAKEDENND